MSLSLINFGILTAYLSIFTVSTGIINLRLILLYQGLLLLQNIKNSILVIFFLFTFFMLVYFININSIDMKKLLLHMMNFLTFFLTFYLIKNMKNFNIKKVFQKNFHLYFVLFSLGIILLFNVGIQIPYFSEQYIKMGNSDYGRVLGPLKAIVFMYFAIIFTSLYFYTKKSKILLLSILFLILLILSEARTVYLCYILAISLLLFADKKIKFKTKLISMIGMFLLLFLFKDFLIQIVSHSISNESLETGTLGGRISWWLTIHNMLETHSALFTGLGPGSYLKLTELIQVESTYFELVAAYGYILPTIFYTYFLYFFIKSYFEQKNIYKKSISLSMFIFLVGAFANVIGESSIFWFFLGFSYGYVKNKNLEGVNI